MKRRNYGSERISVGNWFITTVLLLIPGINIIAAFCYLFSKNRSKRNYVISGIIFVAVIAVALAVTYATLCILDLVGALNDFFAKNLPFMPEIPKLF